MAGHYYRRCPRYAIWRRMLTRRTGSHHVRNIYSRCFLSECAFLQFPIRTSSVSSDTIKKYDAQCEITCMTCTFGCIYFYLVQYLHHDLHISCVSQTIYPILALIQHLCLLNFAPPVDSIGNTRLLSAWSILVEHTSRDPSNYATCLPA